MHEHLVGRAFGAWRVTGPVVRDDGGHYKIGCECHCGTKRRVAVCHLLSGASTGCDCTRSGKTNVRHGQSRRKHSTAEYFTWKGMKARCYNKKDHRYKWYGARGIYVCERWRNSFECFFTDMGVHPKGKTLDRINNDGPYSPGNCRWATQQQQIHNSRVVRRLLYDGKLLPMAEWARLKGVRQDTIRTRLKLGWTVAEALTVKVIPYQKFKKQADPGNVDWPQ